MEVNFKTLTKKNKRDISKIYFDARYNILGFTKEPDDLKKVAESRTDFWIKHPKEHEIVGLFIGNELIGFAVIASLSYCDYTAITNMENVNKKLRKLRLDPKRACILEAINIKKKYQNKGYGRLLNEEVFRRAVSGKLAKRKKFNVFLASTGTKTKGYSLVSKKCRFLVRQKLGKNLWNNFYLLNLKD